LGTALIQAGEIDQRKKVELSLKESEQRLRTLSDTTSAGIFIYLGEKIVYANPAAEQFSGYSANELMSIKVMDIVHPDFRQTALERASEQQTRKKGTTHFEIKIIHKEGEERWMDINIGQIEWSGQQAGIASVFDITKSKQAQEALIRAKEKAEESDRIKTAFLANMSHEIRTPMNGILGFLNLLQNHELSKDKMDSFIKIVNESGERLLNTINDIIEISKIEAGQVPLSYSSINLHEVMNYMLDFFMPEANRRGLILKYKNTANKDIYFRTDRNKIESIISNLIKNALKFTTKGYVEFGTNLIDNKLIIFVKDSGIGIPGKKLKVIFDRFMQAELKIARSHEGSGLGLSISKAYTQLLGGQIWAESTVNKGSEFYVSFDYYPGNRNVKEIIRTHEAIAVENSENTILIAEDDDTSYLYLIKILGENKRLKIIRACTGEEAVQICKDNPKISLILMDIKMPVLDGYKATRQIKKIRKNIPVIAQTAYALPEDREKAMASGCAEYISKPINKESLIELLNKYLK